MHLADVHGAILKEAGYRISQSERKTTGGAWVYSAEFAGEGNVPFVTKASGKTLAQKNSNEESEEVKSRLDLDLNDVNDVVAALKEIDFSKFIILEDFHYLEVEAQKHFAFALKAFHEKSSLCFIVVGVWRDKNRLIYYNGDLTNRVISIDADAWTKQQLIDVIEAGEKLLNISFPFKTKERIVELSYDGVSLVQEACYRICEREAVVETQDKVQEVGSNEDIPYLIKEIVNEQAGRYHAFITNFSEGFQPTDLEMYKWLAYAVIQTPTEDLEQGLRRADVSAIIKEKHPEGQRLNEGNITQALQNAAPLQVVKGIRPIIFDYDQTTRVLTVVDRSFLIWLAHQDVSELLTDLGI